MGLRGTVRKNHRGHMSIPFSINGLGRVGRALLRCSRRFPQLELVGINDLAPAEVLARLVARDSIFGPFGGVVQADGEALVIDGRRIPVFSEPDPAQIPWQRAGAKIVVEATGASRTGPFARGHLHGGVERVVAAWNPRDPEEVDATICMGVNEETYRPGEHRLVSNASCTTHCTAPVVRVLEAGWGIRQGLINSVHGVTNNQALLDSAHPEPRRSRSAMLNMIPTASHAAEAVGLVLPRLAGRLRGFVVRVPAPHGALLDLVVELREPASDDELRDAFRLAARKAGGILAVTEEELVSGDFIGDSHSAIVDLPLIQSLEDGMVRIVAWYDNEWGYASRLAELLLLLGGSTEARGQQDVGAEGAAEEETEKAPEEGERS